MTINKKQHRILKIIVTGAVLCCICATVLVSIPAMARYEENNVDGDGGTWNIVSAPIVDKVKYNGLLSCYPNYMQHDYTSSGTAFHISDVASDTPLIVMPTFSNNSSNLTISCKDLFLGKIIRRKSGDTPEFKLTGLLANQSYTIGDLGYVPASGSTQNTVKCLTLEYTYTPPTDPTHGYTRTTDEVCFPVNSAGIISWNNYGEIQENRIAESEVLPGTLRLTYDYSFGTLRAYIDGEGTAADFQDLTPYIENNSTSFESVKSEAQAKINELAEQAVLGVGFGGVWMDGDWHFTISNIVVRENSSAASTASQYTLNANSALNALRHFNPSASYTSYALTDDDIYNLYKSYMNYVTSAYNGSVHINSSKCSTSKEDYENAWTEDKVNWCEVEGASSVTERFGGLSSRSTLPGIDLLSTMSFTEILHSLKRLDLGKVDDSSTGTVGGTDDPGVSADELSDAACYDAAAPLGWIVCPVIKTVGNATGFMYDTWISPMLNIKASELFTTSDSNKGVYGGWSIFRTFSNILFAIVFVVVILAQITGIGISNYNIKKILPRLIMVVVLVNISFILCQLAVDVSNILGSTLKSTLENLSVGSSNDQQTFMSALGTFVNGLGLGAGVVGGVTTLAGSAVVAANAQYFLIPLLLAILGCAISVLFFFIILGARQAAVVILTVLAPVAIVCYALPNTKTLFDKWKRMFTAMLMVYPICGLLMGGGNFVSALMLTAAPGGWDPLYGLIAMLISVVPFFMVPSVLRSSMAAVGNLGARIQGLGAGLRGGLTRTIKGSNAYQESQNEKLRNLNIRRAQTRVGRYSKDPNAGGGLIGRARRSLGLNDNLSEYKTARLGQAQSTIDKLTGDTGAAIKASWENDGSADNIGTQEDYENGTNTDSIYGRYIQATKDLMKDPNDHGALERQKAAAAILASTNPGRQQLSNATTSLMSYASGLTGKEAADARRVLNRTATNMLNTHATDLGKSPFLSEQFKALKKNEAYGDVDDVAMKESIKSLSASDVSRMSHGELNRYVNAIRNGKIGYGSEEFKNITKLAARAMSDPHLKGNIGTEEMGYMKQLANMRYDAVDGSGSTLASASADSMSDDVANASDDEINRIRQDLQDGTLSGAAATRVLSSLSHTLGRAVDTSTPNAGFNIDANRARQISDILAENGMNIRDVGGGFGVNRNDTMARINQIAGLEFKVPKTFQEKQPGKYGGWKQAQTAGTYSDGSSYNVGDWIKETPIGGGGTRREKLNAAELEEARILHEEDVRAASNANNAQEIQDWWSRH